jgi:hypothetical protein
MTTEPRTCSTCSKPLDRFEGMYSGQCRDCVDVHADTDDDDEPETTTCDFCDGEITQAVYNAGDGLCQTCIDTTIVCEECSDRINKTDVHATHTTLCEGCGDSRAEELATETIDAARDEARELLESILEGEDLDAIRKAIKSLKRLAPKS